MDRADGGIEGEQNGTPKSSFSAAVVRHTWRIGKRVTIAGAAITSAPVIIPPLFVLSTLGLAFSFPFGIYLAGYVCTDKIMSILLPLPPLKEELDKKSLKSEDLIDGVFDADQLDEMVQDEENADRGEIVEGEREEDGISEFWNREGVEKAAVESSVEGKVEEVKTGDMIVEEDEIARSLELGKVRGVQLGEEVREDVATVTESRGSPKCPYTVLVMAANEEGDNKEYEPPELSSEHLSIVELKGERKANDALATKERREDGGEEEKRRRVGNGVVAKDKELSEECSSEVPRLKSDHVFSAVIVPSKDENLEKVGSIEHRSLEKPVPVAVVAVGGAGLRFYDEDSSLQRTHNEEQQWDQIFSMRAIVGYNETLQPSLREELMALYLFIGVEPPVSLKDTTELAEISNSLQFLKSVLGIK